MNNVKKISMAAVAALSGTVLSASAVMDTTAVTAALTDAGAAVAVVGAAVLVVVVATKAFKFVRAAL